MQPSEYVNAAIRTEMCDKAVIGRRAANTARLLHSAMGLCTEAGELMDALKKTIIYGKPIDTVNVREELGDLLWYVAIACDELEVPLEEVMRRNIAKLRARYPEKYSDEKALARALDVERAVLEQEAGNDTL